MLSIILPSMVDSFVRYLHSWHTCLYNSLNMGKLPFHRPEPIIHLAVLVWIPWGLMGLDHALYQHNQNVAEQCHYTIT